MHLACKVDYGVNSGQLSDRLEIRTAGREPHGETECRNVIPLPSIDGGWGPDQPGGGGPNSRWFSLMIE